MVYGLSLHTVQFQTRNYFTSRFIPSGSISHEDLFYTNFSFLFFKNSHFYNNKNNTSLIITSMNLTNLILDARWLYISGKFIVSHWKLFQTANETFVCPFVLFLLAIVLSVLLQYTDFDYPLVFSNSSFNNFFFKYKTVKKFIISKSLFHTKCTVQKNNKST